MKVIDLLNKIANGEEVPNKIKIGTHIFTKFNYSMGDGTFVSSYESNNDGEYYINDFLYLQYLNDEVEILEEEKKIPEKLEDRARFQYSQIPSWFYGKELIKTINENFEKHQKAINEIIDYLKSKGE